MANAAGVYFLLFCSLSRINIEKSYIHISQQDDVNGNYTHQGLHAITGINLN